MIKGQRQPNRFFVVLAMAMLVFGVLHAAASIRFECKTVGHTHDDEDTEVSVEEFATIHDDGHEYELELAEMAVTLPSSNRTIDLTPAPAAVEIEFVTPKSENDQSSLQPAESDLRPLTKTRFATVLKPTIVLQN